MSPGEELGFQTYLGTVVDGRGIENGPSGAGDSDFFYREGKYFLLQELGRVL